MLSNTNLSNRRYFLCIGILAMLFSGVLYAWSILKIPFKELFGWTDSALAFNFTITMCFFCLSAFVGSRIFRRFGPRVPVILAGILVGAGFILTGLLSGNHVAGLYLSYGVLAGSGIGIAYNVVISAVSSWFPDKKGLCSGCLMMGFGASTLILGNVINALFAVESIGWSKTYIILGIVIAAVLIFTGLTLKCPAAEIVFPEPKKKKTRFQESFEAKNYSTTEMLKRFSFWRAFAYLICLAAVGNSVISFARDLALSVGATTALATTMVGVLAVCNGLGRIFTGALFDAVGRKITMIASAVLTIAAATIALMAVQMSSLPFCIAGLCLAGLSYGASPTVSATFTSAFYGQKYFPTNFSIMNFSLIFTSFLATVNSKLFVSTGGYTAPFILLLILGTVSLALTLSIRKP
ncbi:MAG: MFS transporter [Firmicutes bacterium]|nr:MFS transporter [Bacillota bacterium]